MSARRLALALLPLVACGEAAPPPPEGQILLYITTDAPLPPAAGTRLGPDDPPPLFDRARVEIFGPGASTPCAECTHEFDLDRELIARGRASIGLVPPPGTPGYVARVRLYESAYVTQGRPRGEATVDVFTALPLVARDGITAVTVTLRTEDVGKVVGSLQAPLEPVLGRPPADVAMWAPARRRACQGAPAAGEACAPGGAFWMGNPALRFLRPTGDSLVPRVVVLSPFWIDQREVTVRELRASGVATAKDPMPWDPNDGSPGPILHCTFSARPGNLEDLPINCISWERARAYCQTRGGDLPTEAQWEYVAGAFESRPYPWGTETPTCADAIHARLPNAAPEATCPGQWLALGGSGRRDRVVRAEGDVVDLVGNVAEYARDRWNLATERCWGPGVFFDPVCDLETNDPYGRGTRTVVGGAYVDGAAGLPVGTRRTSYDFAKLATQGPAGGVDAPLMTSVGFRCVRPASQTP